MSEILVLGVGPLPIEQAPRLYAPGLRTWSFAKILAAAGHRVLCATADFGGEDYQLKPPEPLRCGAGEVRFQKLPFGLKKLIKELGGLLKAAPAACAVSTTDLMNRALVQARPPCPVWLDFNGHPMVERQMQAAVHRSDASVQDQWNFVLPALLFADRFSACSTPQKYALIGELGAAGRLNRHTAPHDLVAAIQPVCQSRAFAATQPAVRGTLCGEHDFVLLWTGGYNTWSDVDTLFQALELAMAAHPELVYVSTGGKIEGHDEVTFPRFKKMVAQSPHRARYHFAGWVENSALANFYAAADAAINLDVDTYEALLGHRNRVQEWIEAGVPVLSTALSEITGKLAAANLIVSIEPHQPAALAEALGWMIGHRAILRQRAELARDWHAANYAAERLLQPLVEWCGNPVPAPDLPPPAARPKAKWPGPDNTLARSWQKYLKRNSRF